jgi:hypothetical protein
MKLIAPTIAIGFVAACAATAWAQDTTPTAPSVPATTAAPAPAPQIAQPAGHIPPPPAGKSQVVFFRTGAYMGAATWFKVRENGEELGKLSNQSYFVAVLDPGPHTFTAATENQTHLKLELDPDETYYVRGTLQMGLLLYEPNLQPADPELFEKHYTHMHAVAFVPGYAPKDTSVPRETPKATSAPVAGLTTYPEPRRAAHSEPVYDQGGGYRTIPTCGQTAYPSLCTKVRPGYSD